MLDIQGEITERDDLIEQLTESLQQSMTVRAQLQEHSEKLSSEVMQLRDQLTNTIALIRKTPNKITQVHTFFYQMFILITYFIN